MNKIKVSAPGKLMLLGEHAVVYNHPCIVTAVDQRLYLTAEVTKEPNFELNAPDVKVKSYKKPLTRLGKGKIPPGAKFIEIALLNFQKKFKLASGVKIETSSFKSTFGFGSSSASTVCAIYALSTLFKIKLSKKQMFDLAYKTVLDIQGKGSGFDVAAAIYGGTTYFVTGGKTIKPLKIKNLPLIVGYTGIKADTATLISKVSQLAKKHPQIIQKTLDLVQKVTENGKKAIENGNFQTLGELFNINQGYLESLGVSSNKFSAMIYSSREAGAYGAKLSGAGGGDCMIALAPQAKKSAVEKAITKAGGKIIKVQTNAKGVRLET